MRYARISRISSPVDARIKEAWSTKNMFKLKLNFLDNSSTWKHESDSLWTSEQINISSRFLLLLHYFNAQKQTWQPRASELHCKRHKTNCCRSQLNGKRHKTNCFLTYVNYYSTNMTISGISGHEEMNLSCPFATSFCLIIINITNRF